MRGSLDAIESRSPRLRDLDGWSRSLVDAVSRRSVLSLFERLEHGCLAVVDGADRWSFGRPDALVATITVRDPGAYRALLFGGSVGAGEAYMRGHWTCDDLARVSRIFARNADVLGQMEKGTARIPRIATDLMAKVLRRNTRAGSRRNIARHYDLSNEFFALFLDASMTYSSAIFEPPTATLEEAQAEKLERVCRKLDLRPTDHLLEIGTGWGALAIHAATKYGCRVTTTTVSAEQHRLASDRVREAGVEGKVEVLLRDYRDLTGTFEKVVSIEMVEAVGHEFLDAYFRACSERLADDGMLLLQAITIADQRHAAHRGQVDFIKEYIFPGSCIPSITTMVEAATRATDLRLFHLDDITPHYARTLRIWRERLLANAESVRRLGFDDSFLRMWEYYLAYCEGGFEERYLGSVHMLFTKPAARRAPIVPALP
jgi:cyclopropane-fatty-acyl-phospholipid synthase